MADFDVVVIGSGFGGSVAACRMAERGQRVLVLERGRRWTKDTFPSVTGRDWVYDPDEPEKQSGWLDLRFFENMIVAQGAAVGGGSLIYANVSVEPPAEAFASGWPAGLGRDALAPHLNEVGRMLSVASLPDGQRTLRSRLVEEGAKALGHANRFAPLPLAVTFDPDYRPDQLSHPYDARHSKELTNAFGKKQGTCVHLADCDLGCPVLAKNTLDLTYLARAETKGAEIRPLHLVRRIEPDGTGYRVHFDRTAEGTLRPGQVTAERVVVAAGSLGSTELLLRCKHEWKTLPDVSERLGHGWSSNGDFLTPAFYDRKIAPSEGPTISARIDHLDGEHYGEAIFIQDGGFPNVLENYLDEKLRTGVRHPPFRVALEALRKQLQDRPPLQNVMPWFAQGIDAADGHLLLRRRWWLFGARRLRLDWDIDASEAAIDAIVKCHVELARATGGDPWVPPTWTLMRKLVTPHPLGGCNMADDARDGVVDVTGEVFGYERLHVLDGAVIPRAIGRNPSRTIAAVAEHAVSRWH